MTTAISPAPSLLGDIIARAAQHPAHVVLCESDDTRVLQAASRALRDQLAQITLIGHEPDIRQLAHQEGFVLDGARFVDPTVSPLRPELRRMLQTFRPWRRMKPDRLERNLVHPLHFSNLLVRAGYADGSVAGAVYSSSDVIQSATRIIGPAANNDVLSSFFLMYFEHPHHPVQGGMIFADCALNIDPTAEELAQIAIDAAENARLLLNQTPRIAMLSFSTAGSARHPRTIKVIEAARRVKDRHPDMLIDEDIQLDAAVVPEVAARKIPQSQIEGRANVLIFPDLDAGNIGYKMAERFGGATAIGPLLQGLKRPVNDLSRGCSADDIYHAIAVTSIQAHAQAGSAPNHRRALPSAGVYNEM